jgi:sulfonate transport system substrate-binding protein
MENEVTQTPKKNNWRIFAILIILIAVIGFIKFSNNKSNNISKEVPKSDLLKINVAYPALGTTYNGQIGTILQTTDILKKNGLDAKVTAYGTGREMKVGLVAGKEDVMISSESVWLTVVGQGFDSYAISSLGAEGKMALVVPVDSKVKEVKDLKGKKVATMFGTSPHKPAVQWLKDAGLTIGKDVQLVNLPDAATLRAALASKEIDAAVLWDPYVTDGVNNKTHRVIVDTDLDLVTVMSKSFVDANPEAITRFNAALKDAALYLTTHKEELATTYSGTTKLSADLIKQVSLLNKNYNATDASGIDISISPTLAEKLQGNETFLFGEKLINKDFKVADYIKQ